MGKRILGQGVSEYLRKQIVTGRISPGSTIREEHIAKVLDVSRTPVREALRKLAEEGLLEYIPHRGARLLEPTPSTVAEVFEIREALEGIAARQAASRVPIEQLVRVRSEFEKIRVKVASGDLSDVGDGIHQEILANCENRRLERLMSVYRLQVGWLQQAAARLPGRLEEAFREHDGILSALECHDPEWAESATRAHIRNTRRILLEALANGQRPLLRIEGNGTAPAGFSRPRQARRK
jgi:DNA-binding GntR family transcriptional regulator